MVTSTLTRMSTLCASMFPAIHNRCDALHPPLAVSEATRQSRAPNIRTKPHRIDRPETLRPASRIRSTPRGARGSHAEIRNAEAITRVSWSAWVTSPAWCRIGRRKPAVVDLHVEFDCEADPDAEDDDDRRRNGADGADREGGGRRSARPISCGSPRRSPVPVRSMAAALVASLPRSSAISPADPPELPRTLPCR